MNILEGRRLSLDLGGRRVLDDVSVGIEQGEMVSIMGPSGSGKSTLLHVLAGILTPESGEVWLDGKRLDDLSEAKRSRIRLAEMGFVFQFGDLIPELNLVENVALPLQLLGTKKDAARSRALEVMAELGIEEVANSQVSEVSGGQAQRAAVARAIAHQPKVVFADEPTGALDTLAGEQVMDALTSLQEKHGTTVILVTHDARVASYADRNIVVRDGRVTTPTLVTS